MRDQPIDVPFPIAGLNEFPAYDDQTAGTSADMQNVVPVDPKTGRLRGAQRPGTKRFVPTQINQGAAIQDIVHMIGPRFNAAAGAGQQMTNNPAGANWGLINQSGSEYLSGGHPTEQFEMACFDNSSNFYVATRPTTTSQFVNIDKYDRGGKFLGFISEGTATSLAQAVDGGDRSRFLDNKIYVKGQTGDFPSAPFAIRVAVPGRVADEWMWVTNKANSGDAVTEFQVARGESIAKMNASTTLSSSLGATAVSNVTVGTDATITIDGDHLLEVGDTVVISGVEGTTSANGTFTVATKTDTAFTAGINTAADSAFTGSSGVAYATTVKVTSKAGFPNKDLPFTIFVGDTSSPEREKMTVTTRTGTEAWIVTRTAPVAHDKAASGHAIITTTRTWATGLDESTVASHSEGARVFVADRITVDAGVDSSSDRPIRGMVQVGPHLYTLFNGMTTTTAIASGSSLPESTDAATFNVNDAKNISVNTVLRIGTELLKVTGVSGVAITVSRAYAGTDEAAHVATDPVSIEGDPFDTDPTYDCRDTVFRFNTVSGTCPEGTFSVGKPKGFVHSSSTGYSTGTQEAIGTLELPLHRANLLVQSGNAIVYPSTKVVGGKTSLVLNAINPATGSNYRAAANRDAFSVAAQLPDAAAEGETDVINAYAMVSDGVSGVFLSTQMFDDSTNNYTNAIHYVSATGGGSGGASGLADSASQDLKTQTGTDANHYARDIAYDANHSELAAVGKTLFGGTDSMIVYSTVTVGSDPPGTVRIDFQPKDDGTTVATEWHRVQAGANPRSYRLSRTHTTRNNFISLEFDSSYTVSYKWEGGVRTNNNDQDYPLPINVTNQDADDIDRSRDVRLLAVAGGLVYRIEPASEDVVEVKGQTGGPQFSVIRPRIFSAVSHPNIYFADGEANRYYDSATDELKTWQGTAGGGSSSIPVSGGTYCRLICEWGARIVLSGLEAEPQTWFMSAINDPENFNYAEGLETSAVAGSTLFGAASPAGETPDIINALVPWTSDVLLFGMDHSIAALSGNPAGGGRIDSVTQITGMAFGRPYAFHPDRSLWFIGSRGGLYRMAGPTSSPERISATTVDDRLTNIDFSSTVVRMVWDDRLQGFLIFFASIEGGSIDQHYFYDVRTKGWFPWTFAEPAHSPLTIHTFDGDKPDDRTVLYGCPDGYIRSIDYDAASDDAEEDSPVAIASHVLIGPIRNPNGVPVVMTGLTGILGKESSNVTYSIHPGDSAEEASRAASIGGGTFGAGRNTWDRRRTSAAALYIKLSNVTVEETWSIERLTASLRTTSRTFEKAH